MAPLPFGMHREMDIMEEERELHVCYIVIPLFESDRDSLNFHSDASSLISERA